MPDPIGITLNSITAGATAGGAITSSGLIALRLLQDHPTIRLTQDQQFILISAGLLIGIAAAVVVVLLLTRHIELLWRRGVSAAIAVFIIGLLMAATTLVELTSGMAGMVVFTIALLFAAGYTTHKARLAANL